MVISDEIARLYKNRIGRGPTRVSTTIVDDLVVCVLEDTHTPQEATMFESDAHRLVHEARVTFQTHVAPTLIEVVERATGRVVAGHVPGYNPAIDIAVELFMLEDGDRGVASASGSARPADPVPPEGSGG